MRGSLGGTKKDNFHRAFTTLLCLKLRAGCSVGELRGFVDGCTRDAIASAASPASWGGMDPSQFGRVLRAWHLDSEFLTSKGKPRPLRIAGKFGLKSLINEHFARSQFAGVLQALKRNQLVREMKPGFWLPNEQYGRISKVTAELLSYFGNGIVRLADTVTKNISSADKANLLFERCSKVESLPKTQTAAFRQFVEEQATAFITTVDDWLERRCQGHRRRNHSGGYIAGVHTFAFLDAATPSVGRRLPLASKKKKKSRPNRRELAPTKTSATHPSTPASKSSPRSSSATRS
jgi:hypothetical protein